MRSAHPDSSSALSGRQTNNFRRLGVSPGAVVRRVLSGGYACCRGNPWPPRHLGDRLALAVDADLHLMDLGGDAGRLDLELVFTVEREIAVDLQAAARAEGQLLVAAVLGLPHWRHVGVH